MQLDDAQKTGVDPVSIAGNAIHQMSSDVFFASNRGKFDLIFIDGLHHHDQVYRDILHALAALNPNGTIVCHDINPTTYEEQVGLANLDFNLGARSTSSSIKAFMPSPRTIQDDSAYIPIQFEFRE